jgi:transposase
MPVPHRVRLPWQSLKDKQRRRIRSWAKHAADAALRCRSQLIVALVQGQQPRLIADILQCSLALVSKTAQRFRHEADAGLIDRREDNGPEPIPWHYHSWLRQVVAQSPQDYGYSRPTWTQELLVEVLATKTSISVARSTMSRLLRQNGIRRGRPKPYVECPWRKRRRQKRLRELRRLREELPADEVLLWADEIDIHRNPKIGPDYMLRGQQKWVRTPGKNEKRYLAGALDSRSGRLFWEEWSNKSSDLFIGLLWRLHQEYPAARQIHLILDNYKIHKSARTKLTLRALGGRIRLHFLPPYCPDDNRLERVWQDVHANVTRNHRCKTMEELMEAVHEYLKKKSQLLQRCYRARYAA